jgi:hypothetical protein
MEIEVGKGGGKKAVLQKERRAETIILREI